MKLLFNKDNQGSAEIKKLLGFTDGNITYANLEPKLFPATDLVIELIGQPLYDSLVGIYEASSASGNDAEFLRRVQTVIMTDGYRDYAKDNDLSHSPNGRLNQVDDKQKLAWEWQIVNSDKKMERDYYSQLDKLIKYMDKSVSGWKNTQAFKETNNSFVRTTADIDYYFNINDSRLLFLKLMPGIKKAERDHIIPLITKSKYDSLITALKDNDETIDTELCKLIRAAIVYKGLSWSIPRLSAQLFPEGLLYVSDSSRMTISARKSTEKIEAEALSQKLAQDAQGEFEKIADYIKSLSEQSQPYEEYRRDFDCNDKFVDL